MRTYQENADALGEEKRLFERFQSRFASKFKDTRENFGENVTLRNASAQGAMITCKDRLFVNDHVAFEVKLPDHETPMQLKGDVKWSKHYAPDLWICGIEFHKIDLVFMSRLYKFSSPSINTEG